MTITIARSTVDALEAVQADLLTNLAYLQSKTKDRLGGSTRTAFRTYLLTIFPASPLCVICGDATDPSASLKDDVACHLGHLISAEYIARMTGTDIANQGNKGGYVWGNVAIQHKGCNFRAGTSIIRPRDLARPDLVPLIGPPINKAMCK